MQQHPPLRCSQCLFSTRKLGVVSLQRNPRFLYLLMLRMSDQSYFAETCIGGGPADICSSAGHC